MFKLSYRSFLYITIDFVEAVLIPLISDILHQQADKTLSVTTTSIIKSITCDLFSNVF